MIFQVLHGSERGETAALFLSPLRPTFKNSSTVDTTHNGSQFTYFLTAPLPAFCQMVGLSASDADTVKSISIPLSSLMVHCILVGLICLRCSAFRMLTMVHRTSSPVRSLSGRSFSASQLTWILSGHKFYLIHFCDGLFLGIYL